MTIDFVDIAQLLRKKFNGEMSQQEAYRLQVWLDSDARNANLLEKLEEEVRNGGDIGVIRTFDEERAWSKVRNKRRKQIVLYWGRVAAILVAVATFSFFALRITKNKDYSRLVESKDTRYKNDVLPAVKGAKIILGDGREVKINDSIRLLADGSIATEEKTVLMEGPAVTWNTLVVPVANFLNLTLSDGTKVWVNASSKLMFPNRFSKDKRQIKLEGEAYFQVAKDVSRPFVVETVGGDVEVLGTSFNISAYDDSAITTLEEGEVRVSKGDLEEVLHPGMKAQMLGSRIDVRQADVQKELAWKNNSFYFKGDNIVTIAKQLQNWYDLEISFSKGVSLSQTYTGEISRSSNLTEVLKMLEFVSDLDFKIDNNKLLILKNTKV